MAIETDDTTNCDYSAWIGRVREDTDFVDLNRARALHSTLGLQGAAPREGDNLPLLGHWLYFWDMTPPDLLGPDGHPRRGAFLPPIELPRRMWAGSRVRFVQPLRIGATAWRRSTIRTVELKSGGSGRLAVVRVHHAIGAGSEVAIEDEQDIIYRQPSPLRSASSKGNEIATNALIDRTFQADPVLLFRFSALTFNGHRIHYDRDYATRDEQYPGLVVHGPLLAMLMVQTAAEACRDREVRSFGFRARSPIFDTCSFRIGATRSSDSTIDTWVIDDRGVLAFNGTAAF